MTQLTLAFSCALCGQPAAGSLPGMDGDEIPACARCIGRARRRQTARPVRVGVEVIVDERYF